MTTTPLTDTEIMEIKALHHRHFSMRLSVSSSSQENYIPWNQEFHNEYIQRLQIITPRLIAKIEALRMALQQFADMPPLRDNKGKIYDAEQRIARAALPPPENKDAST